MNSPPAHPPAAPPSPPLAAPLSVSEALERILAECPPPAPEPDGVPLSEASGRATFRALEARHDSPPFDTSAMDGYAVRVADLAGAAPDRPVRLPVQGEVAAGPGVPAPLAPGHAARINTGGVLPEGADAVVPVERTREVRSGRGGEDGDGPDAPLVEFDAAPPPGLSIRRRGEDYRAGDRMIPVGRRLSVFEVGLAASLGFARVPVARRPRAGVLSTGDELVEPGGELGPGRIHDSTRHALLPMIAGWGAEAIDLGTVRDDPEAIRERLAAGLEFDVLVTTGGVSMGTRDLVRPTLLALGVREVFHGVRQRPGKPMFFGRREGDRPCLCFGLPGNPVSVMVTALVHLRAALLAMQGVEAAERELPWEPAVAEARFEAPPGLTLFARANRLADRAPGPVRVAPADGQGSHQFASLARSSGIVRVEPGGRVEPGETIPFLDLTRLRATV